RDPVSGEMAMLGPDDLAQLPEEHLGALAIRAFRPGSINLQKYLADEGGYPRWHCELYPPINDPACETLHRTLLWTLYLNDGFDAGETEFLHQRRKIRPRAGSLLLAPAGFTHTHRGNMPRGAHKYIATSWVLFQRGEAVHAMK
ncbi:MAG TPA: 2OG-Fe(II) oxygenase, partial [Rhodanobacteraceae bacterium]|nr:2OG-Fe(II) oxygenase [Rhodanobacteraceae bacterium]